MCGLYEVRGNDRLSKEELFYHLYFSNLVVKFNPASRSPLLALERGNPANHGVSVDR